MHLKQVELMDFLSVKGRLVIDFDKRVTVFLGANDHGKSNILAALEHINDQTPITSEEVNWDSENVPSISYKLSLDTDEAKEWQGIVTAELKKIEQDRIEATEQAESPTPPTTTATPTTSTATLAVIAKKPQPKPELPAAILNPAATELTLTRTGVDGPLQLEGIDLDDLPDSMNEFISATKPRVELFKAMGGSLQDSATAANIVTDEFEFLQGVFFYAGLDPQKSEYLFAQDDKTMRSLDTASQTLDRNLRGLWGQGTDLHFELRHKGTAIEFLANDPSIASRKARMSKRSSGVTQFFRVSMILHARRKKNPANSYIYLFDEPGVYLHPQGQRDLLQVFEELAEENQIVYATHSLFLLNQNFPERHRLIRKDKDGTKVDQKPYRQNWKLATDALGVYLTANILFANKVLIVEGDSDPIYLYELFRELNRAKALDVDLNTLGIVSFGDYKNLRFLLQVFKRETDDAAVLVLVDGDVAGKNTAVRVTELCKRLTVSTVKLQDGRSIEDYCLYEEQFVLASIATLQKAFEAEDRPTPRDLDAQVRTRWEQFRVQRDKMDKREKPQKQDKSEKADIAEKVGDKADNEKIEKVTAGRWFKDLSTELLGDEASKVLLARNYVMLCRDMKDEPKSERLKDAKVVCQDVATKLGLPRIKAEKTIEGNG